MPAAFYPKSPDQMSELELEDFMALVRAGEEVEAATIHNPL